MILGICLMASLVVFTSCKKTTTPSKDKEEEKKPEPEPEPEPVVEPTPDFIYYFDYNKYDILGNGRDVRDLNKEARKAAKEKVTEEVKNIRIEGWASPEGEHGLNMNLSDNRANAAMRDIKAQVKAAKNAEFKCNGNGPDFGNFIKRVRESNIADREQIANEIERAGNKEQKVKEMISIYPELENLFPRLRRAEVYLEK